MLRILSLFSGIGAFEKALTNLGVEHEVVNYCEIDPYASKSYSMVHGISEEKNLRDVTTIDTSKLHDIDLMTWGWPCQDISCAGKQRGFEDSEGNRTRSGLFFEGLRILTDVQPRYAIAENVKALTSKKFEKEYLTVLNELSKAGYNNYVEILNAKNYGLPQNRERVFIVSIRKDIDDRNFLFPEPRPLHLRLKDMLEPVVDERFYLKSDKADKLIESLINSYNPEQPQDNKINALGHLGVGGQKGWVFDTQGISRCLAATDYKDPTKVVVKEEEDIKIQQLGNLYENQAKRGRVYAADGLSPCITSTDYKCPSMFVEPKIKRLGNLYDENAGGARAGNVYDQDGLSPTLQTSQGGNRQPLIVEPMIVASRGRNPDNPGDRTTGAPTEQRLEVNTQGISNTLTTVQKDNWVVEPQILKYERTDYAKSIRKEYESGELSERRCNMRQYTTRNDGLTNTLTTVQKDNYLLEPINPHEDGTDGLVGTLMTDGSSPKKNNRVCCTDLRIRKLTPKECWRLMGFSDEDFDKVHGISNTQLYKQAGNSICVTVLEAIFTNLLKLG